MRIKPKRQMLRVDRYGKIIEIGNWVKLPRTVGKFPVHSDYARIFKRYAGRILQVVDWDYEGYAWLDIGREVLSVEPKLLEVVRHSRAKHF